MQKQPLSTGEKKTVTSNKAKLAFDLLEKEMEALSSVESNAFKGGYVSGWSDCVIEAISFATGRPYDEVYSAYGAFMSSSTGTHNSGYWQYDLVTNGVTFDNAAAFAQYMGLTNVGDTPHGASGYSVSGDQSVAFLNNGGGNGHAIVLTGNASSGQYYYYDPQSGVTGTISKTDPRIIGTYGY